MPDAANHKATLCGRVLEGSAHVCAFFDSSDEKYATLIPFFREGLEQQDELLNVVDDEALGRHVERLRASGLPVDDANVEVLPASEAYFTDGRFDPAGIFALVRAKLAAAHADGIAVRTWGEMNWISDPGVAPEKVIEYEARVNLLTPTCDCTLVCSYDLARVRGEVLADVIATHPFVILRGQVRENPWYVNPQTYLDELLLGGRDVEEGGPADLPRDQTNRARGAETETPARPEGLEPPTT